MVRKPRKDHFSPNPGSSDSHCGKINPSPEREVNAAKGDDSAQFGGTINDSVAAILRRIPILDCGAATPSELSERQLDSGPNPQLGKETQVNAADPGQTIKPADSVRETISPDGAVLLDIKQGLCFSMNPVGSKIWEMLKKEYSLEKIASALEAEFQAPREQIEADIIAFVSELRNQNLIRENAVEKLEEKSTWFSKLMKLKKSARR